MLPPNYLLVINEAGEVLDCRAAAPNETEVEFFNGVLCPGFINCHCHVELSHLKNKIPSHTGLVNFVQQVMRLKNFSRAEKEAAMTLALAQMEATGIVAIGDICNTTDSLFIKKAGSMHWHNFIEISGFVPAGAATRLQQGLAVLQQFYSQKAKGQHSLSPHAPYSVSAKLFQKINEHTKGQLISIHNQEATAENELYQHKTGHFLELYKNLQIDIAGFEASKKSSVQSWMPYFTHRQNIISVHNSFTSVSDVNFMLNQLSQNINSLHFCICINANLYIENTLPPLSLLLNTQAAIVLGTDSYASNEQLSIVAEINSVLKHFSQVSLETALGWATLNGARALGLQQILGSFEMGKKPGVVLLSALNNEQRNYEAKRIL